MDLLKIRNHGASLHHLKERERVIAFLQPHPFLVTLLMEAYEKIREHFPLFTANLEVHTDPDESDYTQLVLSIVTDLSAEDAHTNLQRLYDEWWLDALYRSDRKLCITLEF